MLPASGDIAAHRPRLLVLDALTPTPDMDSGSFITVKMLEAFRQLGLDVSFFATYASAWDRKYAAALQANGIRCLYAPYFTSVAQVVQTLQFDYVLAYRVSVIHPHLEVIRRHAPMAKVIFHNVDLHYLRAEREAKLTGSLAAQDEAARLKMMELEMFAQVDCSIVHTAIEKTLVTEQVPLNNIVEFPYVAGVRRSAVPFETRRDIMFLGGYAHSPNVDAVQFFVAEVWPKLLRMLPPDARFLIVGASPTVAIEALASERIIVTGMVEDLGPWFDRARVFVAPLRYGAGIKGKFIQSLAHGLPSVATTIAAEGIGLDDGHHYIMADEPEAMAAAVTELYEDEALWSHMQEAGYAFVEENFSWARCLEICSAVLSTADETWTRRQERSRTETGITRPRMKASGEMASVRSFSSPSVNETIR
ncbi:MAG: glycosyltransferase [Beijerinckiaceae bacterium]|nr:glycosyltransferase [Beijerinckiaceae bacterium]